MTGRGLLALACILAACGEPAPPRASGELEEGVARVGPEVVAKATVGRIAAAQGLDLESARDRAVADALLAAAARADLGEAAVRRAENRALAWALLGELWDEAREAPISDDELAEATASQWTRYDRPRSVRTIHAVVHAGSDPAAAQAAAERIRAAVEGVAATARREKGPELPEDAFLSGSAAARTDPVHEAFEEAAKAAAGDRRVTVEMLPPVAADGSIVAVGAQPHNASFDPAFAAAATALEARGDLSDVVETRFGHHVILLLGVIPEKHAPAEIRRRELRSEILRVRGLRAQRALLQRLAAERSVEIVTNHAAILEQAVDAHEEGVP